MITATENLLSALMESSDDEEQLPVCLLQVEDKSLGLKFTAAHMAVVLALWQDVAAAINTKNFEQFNPKARECLQEIVGFVKKKQCVAFLGDNTNDTIARFDQSISLPESETLSGKSSILGKVVRVGGVDPRVRLRLPSGKVLTCDTTESVAKELGHRLYDLVTCKGDTTWDFASGDVLKFRIDSVGLFKKTPASEAFANLASVLPAGRSRLFLRESDDES